MPTLVIPWVVIQELDSLKVSTIWLGYRVILIFYITWCVPLLILVFIMCVYFSQENKWKSHESGNKTTRVDMLARVAIKFLNSSFQKSDPHVRGQTVDEVGLSANFFSFLTIIVVLFSTMSVSSILACVFQTAVIFFDSSRKYTNPFFRLQRM